MPHTFADLKNACRAEWDAYIQHPFVQQLGNSTLPADAFRHYLEQDYLFLIQFARAWALAAYKSSTLEDLRHAKSMLYAIADHELQLHIAYCREWGISEAALQALPEARATLAYSRYVLDTGNRGDLLDMQVALAPCVIGYAEVAHWLKGREQTVRGPGNPYEAWIAMYEGAAFQEAAAAAVAWLNGQLAEVGARRMTQLTRIFRDATRLEADFWDMGLHQRL